MKKIRHTAQATKQKLADAYNRDPEQFLMNTMYVVLIGLTLAGGVMRIANGYASYRSKNAYADMIKNQGARR